jgi:hypothetical protein
MGGREGMRGYLVQTLIAVLEALDGRDEWSRIGIEPDAASEKVDLFKESAAGTTVAQIKSSENQIGKADAERWAAELEQNTQADRYHLILVGPCSQGVLELKQVGSVTIPPPQNLDLVGMIERAAHRLDHYLEGRNVGRVPAFARELLIHALITKLELYSTGGQLLDRSDLVLTLDNWILTSLGSSVTLGLEMQCDVVTSTLGFVHPQNPQGSPSIIIPITFVNQGVRTAIVEWAAVRVLDGGSPRLYGPLTTVDFTEFLRGKRVLHASNIIGQFTEFAVLPLTEKSICILFNAEVDRADYPVREWVAAQYTFELWVKYRDREIPVLQRTLKLAIHHELMKAIHEGGFITNIREIAIP